MNNVVFEHSQYCHYWTICCSFVFNQWNPNTLMGSLLGPPKRWTDIKTIIWTSFIKECFRLFLIFHILTIVFLRFPFCLFSPWKTLVPLVRREHFSCFTTHLSNFCFAPSRKTIQLSFRTNLFYSTTPSRCTWKPSLLIFNPNFDFFSFFSQK